MKSRRLPFSFLLPLLALLLWVGLVVVPATFVYFRFQQGAHGAPTITLHAGQLELTVQRSQFLAESLRFAASPYIVFLRAVNVAGFIVDILVSRLSSSWPSMWCPPGFSHLDWPGIAYPIYCLPFWAFTGRGIDAAAGRRLRWPWLLLGTLLCSAAAITFFGLRFSLSAEERGSLKVPLWSFALWAVLLSSFPVTWIRQWRNSKRLASPTTDEMPA